jgi:urea ABC transporter permease protein UrtC
MSLGLLWGWASIVSFGQAAFFAIGAYGMGLAMQAGLGGWGGYAGIICGAVAGGLLAAIAGYFLFSAAVTSTYFVLITLALSIIVEQLAVSQSEITGGYNGLFVDRMALVLGPFGEVPLTGDLASYYAVLLVVPLLYFGLLALIQSSFGKVLVGIRENEDRMTALGYNVSFYKTVAFALSGALAGFAGSLYATHAGFVSPSLAGVNFSTEVVVWVAIGGRLSLLGALIGGVVVSALSNYLSSISPQYWQLVLGFVFILVIMFSRDGLAGAFASVANRFWRRSDTHRSSSETRGEASNG